MKNQCLLNSYSLTRALSVVTVLHSTNTDASFVWGLEKSAKRHILSMLLPYSNDGKHFFPKHLCRGTLASLNPLAYEGQGNKWVNCIHLFIHEATTAINSLLLMKLKNIGPHQTLTCNVQNERPPHEVSLQEASH